MKRAISVLLTCLLLCGLAMPGAMAADEVTAEDLIAEWKLLDHEAALEINTPIRVTLDPGEVRIYPFEPSETGWVSINMTPHLAPGQSCAVLDGDWNLLGSIPYIWTDAFVKLIGGKTYYFVPYEGSRYGVKNIDTTLILNLAEKPVLRQDVMKLRIGDERVPKYLWTFAGGWVLGSDHSIVTGGSGVLVLYEGNYVYTYAEEAGTHTIQFTNYDGEDLGTLTIIIEEYTLRDRLEEWWAQLNENWANEDKSSSDWLKGIGIDLLLILGSPIIVPAGLIFIFFMGPIGWLLLPLPLILPFYALSGLATDIVGLFKSIFN